MNPFHQVIPTHPGEFLQWHIDSAKWFPLALIHSLNMRQARLVIFGTAASDGDKIKSMKAFSVGSACGIYTSSTRERDDLVMLLIVAGYRVFFSLSKRAGHPVMDPNGRPVDCTEDSWRISYSSHANPAKAMSDVMEPADISLDTTRLLWNMQSKNMLAVRGIVNKERRHPSDVILYDGYGRSGSYSSNPVAGVGLGVPPNGYDHDTILNPSLLVIVGPTAPGAVPFVDNHGFDHTSMWRHTPDATYLLKPDIFYQPLNGQLVDDYTAIP